MNEQMKQAYIQYADAFLKMEIERHTANGNLARYSPEEVEEKKRGYHANMVLCAEELANEILHDKPALWESCCKGRFNTSNKISRALFQGVTGIKLASAYRDADKQLQEYVGHDVVAARAQRIYEEQQKKAEEDRLKKQAAYDDWINRIQQSLVDDKPIGGESLVGYARHIGIDVHPRTAGTLFKRVSTIQSGTATTFRSPSGRKSHLPDTVWDLYRAVREHALNVKGVPVESN